MKITVNFNFNVLRKLVTKEETFLTASYLFFSFYINQFHISLLTALVKVICTKNHNNNNNYCFNQVDAEQNIFLTWRRRGEHIGESLSPD